MEDKTMKKMILGTMMCVMMTVSVSAQTQVQDSVSQKRESKAVVQPRMRMHNGKHIGKQNTPQRIQVSPEKMAEVKTKYLTQKLTLSEQQSAELNKVLLKEIESFRSSKAELKEKAENEKKEAFKTIRQETNIQLKQILTEEQYIQYRELAKQRREAVRGNQKSHHTHHGKGQPRMKHESKPNCQKNENNKTTLS